MPMSIAAGHAPQERAQAGLVPEQGLWGHNDINVVNLPLKGQPHTYGGQNITENICKSPHLPKMHPYSLEMGTYLPKMVPGLLKMAPIVYMIAQVCESMHMWSCLNCCDSMHPLHLLDCTSASLVLRELVLSQRLALSRGLPR